MHPTDLRPPRWLSSVLVIAAGAAGLASSSREVRASEPEDPPAGATFAEILEAGTQRTFHEVARHLERNPSGADSDDAHRWLFATAREYGWENDALPAAQQYLAREGDAADIRRLAGEIEVLAPARAGKLTEAVQKFEAHLASVRLRSADAAIRLAMDLAAQAQLSGDVAAARAVFEKLPRQFFLNRQVEEFCNNRLAKLDLIGHRAPPIAVRDLSGEAVTLEDYAGKVVLVDFWATDCAPCLEELPHLKWLFAEHSPRGFEIVGISLDEQEQAVEEFRRQRGLRWRMALSSADQDATRDRYRARTIPSLFLIDRKGRIAFTDLRGRALEAAIERLVRPED